MRILKFLLSSAIVIALVVAVVGLIAREALLIWATSKVSSSLSELHALSKNSGDYNRQCRLKGSPSTTKAVTGLQLRFTSPTEYVTEVICEQFPLDPIQIRSEKLPFFVHKNAGSSGIIWGKDLSGVEIEIVGRRKVVQVNNEDIEVVAAPAGAANPIGVSPQSTCDGYGYMCCQSDIQQGTGGTNNQVTDCPKSCFAACVARPVVLSFSSDPFPDPVSHVAQLQSGESMTFSYVVSAGDQSLNVGQTQTNQELSQSQKQPALQVVIEYGDGQRDTASKITGQFTHVYSCSSNNCNFFPHLSAKDGQGVASADTPLTSLSIVVR
jgi:hypothetical protein